MKKLMYVFMVLLTIFFVSCASEDEKEDGEENETKISANGLTESHNVGKDCMSCHKSGGSGEGWFTTGGTIYMSDNTTAYPNGLVKFYTATNQGGTLVKTVQVDAYGNFYTTEAIDFSSQLFPVVEYNGQTKKMVSGTSSGRCYTCHVSGGIGENVVSGP